MTNKIQPEIIFRPISRLAVRRQRANFFDLKMNTAACLLRHFVILQA